MISLAIKLLRYDKAKFAAMIMAIALAAFLMQNQASILAAFLGMSGSQIRDVREANLWVMEPDTECFDQAKPLPDKALQVVRGVRGVEWMVPLLKIDANARTETGKLRTVTVLGVDPANRIGEPKMRIGHAHDITTRNVAVVDPGGWDLLFGGEPFAPGRRIRIHDQWITLAGLSDASPPFTGFPVLHTSLATAKEMNRAESRTNTYLVGRAQAGHDPAEVALRIEALTHWRAYTSLGFEKQSFRFYESQGVPMIFYITIAIGLIVGTAFTAQTFLMFVKENARGLTTLKVMGVTHAQLGLMMAVQAGLITFLGLAFGTLAAAVVSEATNTVPMLRGLYIPIPVLIYCSLFMAVIAFASAFVAFRRMLTLQPADIFRS